MTLTNQEQRDAAREQLEQQIEDDPTSFVEWLGKDRHDLLVEIMGAMKYGTGLGPSDKYFKVRDAIEGYINRYIESKLS
jgi:hypothetical protein